MGFFAKLVENYTNNYNAFLEFIEKFPARFETAFIADNRWRYMVEGLGNTLLVTFYALIIGVLIGIIISLVRASWDKTAETMRPGFGKFIFGLANGIFKIYITIIRGTPVVVQLLIIFFVIMPGQPKLLAGVITFGINSGAYVAEIIRGGIMSVDKGQMEAGRSLGFGYVGTMIYIVLPQAFKTVLPSLANEFIVLIKETSILGFVGFTDLNRAAQIIISRTYYALIPYIAIALVYLIMVMFFTAIVNRLERRLQQSEGQSVKGKKPTLAVIADTKRDVAQRQMGFGNSSMDSASKIKEARGDE